MKTTMKIWVGVGAFVVAGGSALSAAAQGTPALAADAPQAAAATATTDTAAGLREGAAHHRVLAQSAASHSGHGGEGGGEEGGEKGAAASLPPDLGFALSIAQLRGHLLVGDELVRQEQWTAALPHFLHPTEEIYGRIRAQLKDYRTPPFEAALKALAQTVKAKKGGEDYAKALKTVEEALAASDAGLKSKQQNWDGFTAEAAVELIKSAAGEYEEAIVNGRIAKPVEYQDARGFIWQAEGMLQSVAPALEKKDAEAFKHVHEALAELKKAFPQTTPPKKPVRDYGALLGDVSRVELAAGRLM